MTVDLSTVPLVALSKQTKHVISTLLNPPKVIPCDDGLPRDWRGLAHLSNLSGELMPLLTSHPDPSDYILTIWQQRQKSVTILDFQTILEQLDRWDIVDDTVELLEKDAAEYLEQVERSQTSAEVLQNEIDNKVLTVDDLHRLKQGLENQYYDAFLLYADEDVNFASEMVEKLENQYNLKLCIKDRDLIGGVTFEHEAVMTLISERCNRLIVIVSSNFLKSPANKFFLNYAQALGIDKRQRKVIPCLYEKCRLPPQLNYMFILDYNRVGLYDFWGKLRDSVQTAQSANQDVKSVEPMKETNPEKKNYNNNNNNNVKPDLQGDAKSFENNQPDLLKVLDTDARKSDSLKNSVHTSPSLRKNQKITASCDSLNGQKEGGKRPNNLLRWTKGKLGRKSESGKKEYQPITETVSIGSLPSLTGLDSLNSVDSIDSKKQKSRFLDKYVRRVKLKNILVKS